MVIDTNVLLYHLDGRAPVVALLDRLDRLGEPLRISVVTRIEVLGHPRVAGALDASIRRFLDRFVLLSLTDAVVERTIAVRRSARLKLPDAVIAATALEAGETLITHDRRGFSGVAGLRILDPLPPVGGVPGPAELREKSLRYHPAPAAAGRGAPSTRRNPVGAPRRPAEARRAKAGRVRPPTAPANSSRPRPRPKVSK